MKKSFFLFITIVFTLTGCSTTESIINKPYEIALDNEILSYYGSVDDIPEKCIVTEASFLNFYEFNVNNNDGIMIAINNNNSIRGINIKNKDVITYKQISVGDDVNLLKNTFSNLLSAEDVLMSVYAVAFNENGEINLQELNETDYEESWIFITYVVTNSKITEISIGDSRYHRVKR